MNKTILIVDDEPEMLNALRNALEHYHDSFSILIAGDGEEALDILAKNDVSLVVTDLIMPNMDGLTLLIHIRSDFPKIPVIIMTAYSQPVMERMAWKIGVAEYIEKPFSFMRLAKMIVAGLGDATQGDEWGAGHIKIPLFLQLISLEKRTCTVKLVEHSSLREGMLVFRGGVLVDARLEGFPPEEAAFEMLGWDDAHISMGKEFDLGEKHIVLPMRDLVNGRR